MSSSSILPIDSHDRSANGLYDDVNDRVVAQRAYNVVQSSLNPNVWVGDPITNSAVAGYVVAATGGSAPAAHTTGGADYAYTWANQVSHIMVQNNTTANVQWELDTTTTNGSPVLPAGQTLFLDIRVTVLHLLTAANQNVNGSVGVNIVVKGWN